MTPRTRLQALVWAMLLLMGCGGGCSSGCGGCGGMTKIEGGFPPANRQSESISVKLTESGIQSVTSQVPALVESLTNTTGSGYFAIPSVGPAQVIHLGTAPFDFNINAYVCQAPIPFGDCTASLHITGVDLGTQQNNADGSVTVNVTIKASISTTGLPINLSTHNTLLGQGCALECLAYFDTHGTPIGIKIDMKLRVDHNYNNILAMSVDIPDFASSIPPNDLTITGNGNACGAGLLNFTCSIIDTNLVKQILFSQIQSQLEPAIQDMIDGFRCLPCETDNDCHGTAQVSTCGSTNVCYVDQANHICVPNPLGMEGRMNVGGLLSSFGAPADASLDLSIIAGGMQNNGKPSLAAPHNDIQVGVMGGSGAPKPAACVPAAQWTTVPTPPEMDFDTEAHNDGYTDYGIGIAVSDPFMDKALFDVWQSGMLCLNVAQENVSLLTSTLIGGFLTNMDALTHKEAVPMLVALRPQEAPKMRVGKGTTKLVNGQTKLDDPLITLTMPKVNIDFYAFLEERYTRLVTVQTDLSVSLGLDFVPSDPGPGTSVNLLLGDISAPEDKTRCLNNDMNVVSDEDCKNFLPSVLGLLGGQLTSALPSFDIPTFQGIQLDLQGAKGSIQLADHSGYQHLAIFGKVSVAPAGPEVASVRTAAAITGSFVPSSALPVNEATKPHVTIQATATGARSLSFRGYEYGYRIDGGMWSIWTPDATFVVDSPVLRLPGNHDIQVRARAIGETTSVDTQGAHVFVPVDYAAPVVTLKIDPSSGLLVTNAYDDATPADQIAFRYSINGAEWSSPESAHTIDPTTLSENAWVRVEASDLAGHSAIATYGSAQVQKSTWAGPTKVPPTISKATAAGCSATDLSPFAFAGLAALLARRRRR